MRCLIISDIHSNLAAFEAVLADAKSRNLGHDIVWCLGDVVGYGPDPNECVELLRTLAHDCLTGNHDYAVLGKLDLNTFHDSAADAARWTRATLHPHNLSYLDQRPETLSRGDFTLVHGSPREPIWEYMLDVATAEDNFPLFKSSICLLGHTHVPLIFVEDSGSKTVRVNFPEPGVPFMLRKNCRYILNPGGLGQPRDGDARASYALLDTSERVWTNYRCEYDVKQTQQRMRKAGLPAKLIERLEFGR